jgi:AcrR family transcriptional regulator
MGRPSKEAETVRLSRNRIIRAAIELADAEGIDGLSMRRLAEELDAAPMALYRHVANKDDLLDGMIDLVFAELEFPTGSGWRAAMRERAIGMRQALLRHPWAVGRMEGGTPGPASIRHHNATMGCLREQAGLSFPMAVHAYSVMDSYIYGFALQETTLPFRDADETVAEAQRRQSAAESVMTPDAFAKEYPFLFEIAQQLTESPYDFDAEFEFGLDLIFDGVERLVEHETATTTRRRRGATGS